MNKTRFIYRDNDVNSIIDKTFKQIVVFEFGLYVWMKMIELWTFSNCYRFVEVVERLQVVIIYIHRDNFFYIFIGITDSIELWELEKAGSSKEISSRRAKRWGFSINELLKDPVGRDYFWKFLDKEYSSENLRFYEACIQLRFHTPQKDVLNRVKEIYNEFLSPGLMMIY